MPHPDEGLIHAWLDGELPPEEAARVERLVNENSEWAAAAAEARGFVAAASRILGALDVVPGDVLPADSRGAPASGSTAGEGGRLASASPARSRFTVRPWMRVAAGLAIIVGTTVVVTNRVDVDTAFEPAGVAERVTAQMQPSAVADPDGRVAADSVSREATRVAAIADAVSPSQQKTSQSPATASAPAPAAAPPAAPPAAAEAPAKRLEPFGSAVVVTPPAESPPVDNVVRLRSERGFGAVSAAASPVAAGMSVSATVLDGCWRTITRAAVDSVLVSPRITATSGRMLTIAAGELTVTVVQQADTLRGTIIDADGARVPFRAERIVCRD